MRHWTWGITLFLAAASAAWARTPQVCEDDTYGTAVHWMKDAAKAAEQARAERKLILVVHLAGELDDADRT